MLRASFLIFAFLFLAAAPLGGQEPATFARGRVVERVVTRGDTAQGYALYLPSSYDASRRWPVLFLMDPRGRALLPLERFRPAAERLGYVVLSSYNTLSDSSAALDVNRRALEAMLGDAQERFTVDPRRLYLGGFSGTARVAWALGLRLRGHVAGVVGFGAGLPGDAAALLVAAAADPPFAFFGGAGDADFNAQEVRALAASLEQLGYPHHVVAYPGGHAWPPEAVCTAALEWLELRAMAAGLRPGDPARVDSLYAARLAEAAELEAGGRHHEAWTLFRAAERDFAGLRDPAAARAGAARLARAPGTRRTQARLRALAARDSAFSRTLAAVLARYAGDARPPPAERTLRELGVAALRREAADGADPLGAAAAAGLLERAVVSLALYAPREQLRRGEPARAAALLRAAAAIRPGDPQLCLALARALAGAGERAEALDALACAAPALAPAQLDADPALAPLRGDPRFGEIRARAGAPPR